MFFFLCCAGQALAQQAATVTGTGILQGAFHRYMEVNNEYRQLMDRYEKSQKTIDSCYAVLEVFNRMARGSALPGPERKGLVEFIEKAKNDESGDLHKHLLQFPKASVERMARVVPFKPVYECEFAILLNRKRRADTEAWAQEMAGLANGYYSDEFFNYSFSHSLAVYRKCLPLEHRIDSLVQVFEENKGALPGSFAGYKDLVFQWRMNRKHLRASPARNSLWAYLEQIGE